MRLSGLSKHALERIRRRAQWEVDESGQAVPVGGYAQQPASEEPTSDLPQRVDKLEQQFQEQNAVVLEWIDYLNQYNSGFAETINEMWTDVGNIGQEVEQIKQKSIPPTPSPQIQQPAMSKQKTTNPSALSYGQMW